MKIIATILSVLLVTPVIYGQYYQSTNLPEIRIDHDAATLQSSLFPKLYRTRSAVSDQKWVKSHDSALVAFWNENGDFLLETMTSLSGIRWEEDRFPLHLVRFYPSIGSSNPLIIPIGGIRDGSIIEAAPTGAHQILNLTYQLAHRNIAQLEILPDSVRHWIAGHPIVRPGYYRRDNLAMLLALVTCQQVIGLDSTFEASQSKFWTIHHPGREILQTHFLSEWILTSNRTLADWIADEPYNSRLVAITRPPRPKPKDLRPVNRVYIEGLPLVGRLGFSVKTNDINQLVVDQIDQYRLAYASGLREGDIIRSVNTQRVRNQKDMIEKILATLDSDGVVLQIRRDNQPETVILQNIEFPYYDESFSQDYYDDYIDSTLDSTKVQDSL